MKAATIAVSTTALQPSVYEFILQTALKFTEELLVKQFHNLRNEKHPNDDTI